MYNFTNYLSKVSNWKPGVDSAIQWPTGLGGKGNAGIAQYVKTLPGSIGYVEYAYALQNKLTVASMKNKDGNIHEEYCRVRNQVKTMIKRARKKFEKESAMLIKENPKTAWKYIKSKFKIRDGVQNLRTDTTDINSPLTKTDSEKAEVLSEFFTSVFVKEPEGDIPQLEPRRIRHCMTKLNISEKDIKKKLDKLNTSKSPGLDKLHPHILKNL